MTNTKIIEKLNTLIESGTPTTMEDTMFALGAIVQIAGLLEDRKFTDKEWSLFSTQSRRALAAAGLMALATSIKENQ